MYLWVLVASGCNKKEFFDPIVLNDINQFVLRDQSLSHEEIAAKSPEEIEKILKNREFELVELKITNSITREAIAIIPSGRKRLRFNPSMNSGRNGNVEWREVLYTGTEGEFRVFEIKSIIVTDKASFEVYIIAR